MIFDSLAERSEQLYSTVLRSDVTDKQLNGIERKQAIVQIALTAGRVNVQDLAEHFDVSTVTIRADLKSLDDSAILVRTRGGAIPRRLAGPELSITEKTNEHAGLKRQIGEKACEFIREGDAIILDSGTTTAELAQHLSRFENLMVMTNGLNIAQALVTASGVEVMLTGGTLRKKSQSIFGKHAEDSLSHYQFDKLILGVDGFDIKTGLTTHSEYEASLNRRMCASAKEIIVVTDSSKFDRASLHKICGFDEIDILITDAGIPDSIADTLRGAGVELIIV